MKLQLIQAPNMKQAMLRIYEELGANALIYRTRNSINGIEVLAGVPTDPNKAEPYFYKDMADTENNEHHNRIEKKLSDIDQTMRDLSERINLIKQNEKSDPEIARQYCQYFKKLGFSTDHIHALFDGFISQQVDTDQLLQRAVNEILRRITLHKKEHYHQHRVAALVGPTGVGKTTTIVKIAQRFLQTHSASEIAIISTDNEDLCIKNKLNHYCDLYQIDYEFAGSSKELNNALKKMKEKKLVLIDTHGVSQRDSLGIERLSVLLENLRNKIHVYLTLSTNQHELVLNEIVENYKMKHLAGCILTKMDESVSVTSALGAVIQHNLSIAYMCNGQDIEKDIFVPTHQSIVTALPMLIDQDTIAIAAEAPVSKNLLKTFKFTKLHIPLHLSWKNVFRAFRFGTY